MGEKVGTKMANSGRFWIVFFLCFFLGFVITISEPDLQVLAEQVPSIPNLTLILTVAVGVGIFLAVAIIRILQQNAQEKHNAGYGKNSRERFQYLLFQFLVQSASPLFHFIFHLNPLQLHIVWLWVWGFFWLWPLSEFCFKSISLPF